ncbi:MAG: hypothetical protein SA339_05550, partial [Methanomassiliicoccus sp.]|nr:hypothetical protein [Methanomassiliicoccus sp.]
MTDNPTEESSLPLPSIEPHLVQHQKRRGPRKLIIAVVAIVALIMVIAVLYSAFAPTITGQTIPTTTTSIAPTPISTLVYNYTVTNDNGTYNVTDTDGVPFYTGDDASAAIQTALDSMTSERTAKEAVLLEGDFIITETIHIPSYTILVLNGTVTWGSDETGYLLAAENQTCFEVQGGNWDGTGEERSTTSDNNPMNLANCTNMVI